MSKTRESIRRASEIYESMVKIPDHLRAESILSASMVKLFGLPESMNSVAGLASMQDALGLSGLKSSVAGLASMQDILGLSGLKSSVAGLASMQDALGLSGLKSSVAGLASMQDALGLSGLKSSVAGLASMQDALGLSGLKSSVAGLASMQDALGLSGLKSSVAGSALMQNVFGMPESIREIVERERIFQDIFASGGAVASAFEAIQNKNIYLNSEFTTNINALSRELAAEDIQIENDGSLSLGGHRSTLTETSIEVDTFLKEITKDFSVEKILFRLSKLQGPARSIILWILENIVLAVFINVISAGVTVKDVQNYFDSCFYKSKRDVVCSVKKIPKEIDLDVCFGYKVVVFDNLILRLNSNMKSPVIKKLKQGQLVRVIQKKRNWSKVEVEASGSRDKTIGWVLTRYIVPIKR